MPAVVATVLSIADANRSGFELLVDQYPYMMSLQHHLQSLKMPMTPFPHLSFAFWRQELVATWWLRQPAPSRPRPASIPAQRRRLISETSSLRRRIWAERENCDWAALKFPTSPSRSRRCCCKAPSRREDAAAIVAEAIPSTKDTENETAETATWTNKEMAKKLPNDVESSRDCRRRP